MWRSKKLKTKTGQPRDISEFKLFIQELKDNGVDVKFIYYDNNLSDSIGHKERYIIYDDVQIYIPGGLDIFDKNGRFQNTGEGFYLIFKKREIKLKGELKSLV
ncbi:MAG: hypothetical protein IPJ75_14590 [Ignavibacteriales bacterium]|nr:hypothetical protein [Ignavibacteriales bacterium]